MILQRRLEAPLFSWNFTKNHFLFQEKEGRKEDEFTEIFMLRLEPSSAKENTPRFTKFIVPEERARDKKHKNNEERNPEKPTKLIGLLENENILFCASQDRTEIRYFDLGQDNNAGDDKGDA